jgi:hypothetical protein
MLANIQHASPQSGSLSKDVHLPATSLYELLDFINDELPRWRDRHDRKEETSETSLTSQLCAHLNSATRHAVGWDYLQFRTEEPDERTKGRKLDLVAAPCGTTVWIEGRRHVDFDPLLPIECKRLPTPKDKNRDEREYVINRHGSTGGIQRFKAGHHGARHKVGAMIAYVQQETRIFWGAQVAEWIKEIVAAGQAGWTARDLLDLVRDDDTLRLAVLRSAHTRENGLPEIELRHLWVSMN